MHAVHVLHQEICSFAAKPQLNEAVTVASPRCAEGRQSCVSGWSHLSYSVSKYFCLHCGTIVAIRPIPSCQGHLSLVVCARAAFVVVFFNRRHQTRHAKNCGAIYVLYVCAQHPICMYNDNNDKWSTSVFVHCRCLEWRWNPKYCLEWEQLLKLELPLPAKWKWNRTSFSSAHPW